MDVTLLGDLRERSDGGFDGWCWAPDRPDERVVVDLLLNDTVAASMVAAIFRRDLMTGGYGDGRHGFALRLPPNLPAADDECLVTARERRSGAIFGRVLRRAQGVTLVGGSRLERVAESVAATWQGLDAAGARSSGPPASARLRAALGALADRLAAGPGASSPVLPRPFGGAGLPPGPRLVLPDHTRPAFSLVLPVGRAAAALCQIKALAPALALAGAEIIAVDPGNDPFAALLPARVQNLRYLRDGNAAGAAQAANLAAAHARGRWLLMLGDCPEAPSAAALLALARIAAAHPDALLLGVSAQAAVERVGAPAATQAAALPGRLGVSFCVARAVWDELGPLEPGLRDGAALECADLAFRARLLGVPVVAVLEPASRPAPPPASAAPSPTQIRRALAAFHDRWGAPHGELDRHHRPA